jgi:hypothetical protein
MSAEDRVYHHSGKVSPVGLLVTMLVGVVVIRILAAIYGFLMFASFLFYLCFLFPFLYGIAIGGVIGLTGHFGKIRNVWVIGLLGLGGGLLADYLGWSEWVYYPFEESYGAAAHTYSIAQIFAFAKEFASERGYVMVTGTEIRGFLLWAAWVLEFLTVVGMCVWLSVLVWASMGYFCERCRRWTDGEFVLAGLQNVPSCDISPRAVRHGDLSGIFGLGWSTPKDRASLKVRVDHCTGCKQLNVLNLFRVQTGKDKEGKARTAERVMVSDVMITAEEFEQLRAMKSGRPKELRREEARGAGR